MYAKNVLVTGGTGFIGAVLVKVLVDRGYRVRVLDNQFRGNAARLAGYLDRVELVEGDIRDEPRVMAATEDMDVVYHLAFINGTRFFYEIPDQVLDVGVRGTLNTLKAAQEHHVKRYILASSFEVYQTPTKVPTDESERIFLDDITNPRYSYAGGKIISELLAINFLRKSATETIIFRPHNIFGPDMGYEHVIPELLVKISEASDGFRRGKARIQIQGTGGETRAFCFIDNAVEQIIACGEKGNDGEIYHVGEMKEISIIHLIAKLSVVTGMDINIVPGALRKGGTPRRCPDTSKVMALGCKISVPFEEGLQRTVEWYIKNA